MLKIKDEVDLKELEKFGFNFNKENGKYECYKTYSSKIGAMGIIIKSWDREIYIWSNTNCITDTKLLYIIYDLTQAGLVEKVEG